MRSFVTTFLFVLSLLYVVVAAPENTHLGSMKRAPPFDEVQTIAQGKLPKQTFGKSVGMKRSEKSTSRSDWYSGHPLSRLHANSFRTGYPYSISRYADDNNVRENDDGLRKDTDGLRKKGGELRKGRGGQSKKAKIQRKFKEEIERKIHEMQRKAHKSGRCGHASTKKLPEDDSTMFLGDKHPKFRDEKFKASSNKPMTRDADFGGNHIDGSIDADCED